MMERTIGMSGGSGSGVEWRQIAHRKRMAMMSDNRQRGKEEEEEEEEKEKENRRRWCVVDVFMAFDG